MIIGLTGLAGSGKSEVAKYIQNEHRTFRVNMKDALVKEIKELFPELLEQLSLIYEMSVDELFEKKPPAMRALMQNHGTDVRRNDDEKYWVRKWERSVDGLVNIKYNVVVDDVRFLNEADAVKMHGGIIVRVVREDLDSPMGHSSETQMSQIEPDFTIMAKKGDVPYLLQLTDKVLQEVKDNVD